MAEPFETVELEAHRCDNIPSWIDVFEGGGGGSNDGVESVTQIKFEIPSDDDLTLQRQYQWTLLDVFGYSSDDTNTTGIVVWTDVSAWGRFAKGWGGNDNSWLGAMLNIESNGYGVFGDRSQWKPVRLGQVLHDGAFVMMQWDADTLNQDYFGHVVAVRTPVGKCIPHWLLESLR